MLEQALSMFEFHSFLSTRNRVVPLDRRLARERPGGLPKVVYL
jgi:hypothetical protein